MQLFVNKHAFTPAKNHEMKSIYHHKQNQHKLGSVHLIKKLKHLPYQNTTKAYSPLINSC